MKSALWTHRMLALDLQNCPRCGGVIAREHHAIARHSDRIDHWLHCDFCGIGWETSEYSDGDILALDYRRRTEPVAFGRFLQRLEDARCA